MASERRVGVLTRHLTSAAISTNDAVPDFDAGRVYLFLTRDNVELRAKMLDFMKACAPIMTLALLVFTCLLGRHRHMTMV